MVNLIIDLDLHCPHLKYLIKNSLYYGRENSKILSLNHSVDEMISKFNLNIIEEKEKIKKFNKIDNLYIIMGILSTEKREKNINYTKWIDKYKCIYKQFINKIEGKIIIIDNNGSDCEPNIYLNKFDFKYDLILKRTYSKRNNQRYLKNTFSYPFVMSTSNDPMYRLFNSNIITLPINKKINKIYFSGSLFKHLEKWDNNNIFEHADRKKIVNDIKKKYPNILDIKKVPNNVFVKTISKYKYALDIRGYSRLNKRLYEILSTNTLLLSEKIDVIWPFEDGDSFSEECFFQPGKAKDLYRIYNNFENSPELYNKCLENQLYIVNKYFNNEWLWGYIENIINNNDSGKDCVSCNIVSESPERSLEKKQQAFLDLKAEKDKIYNDLIIEVEKLRARIGELETKVWTYRNM